MTQDIAIQIVIVLGVLVVAYGLLIRPQLNRLNKQQSFLELLKEGDMVVTSGGLIGKVTGFEGGSVVAVQFSEFTHAKVMRDSLDDYFHGGEPPLFSVGAPKSRASGAAKPASARRASFIRSVG